ncbi:MAG: NAD(P)/FAD-dependent oxidoreductase, partial [Methanobrevibacter sp.]|nr:NAD(P)/FAD-dependent oxidoreductase [Methanobrevibacter sp.]
DLPNELIINKVKGAFLHTTEKVLKVQKNESEAYVIDRIAYDQFLFNRVADSKINIEQDKVISLDLEKGILKCKSGKIISSKIIVGADGHNSIVSKAMNNKYRAYNASQFLIKINDFNFKNFRKNENVNDYVDIYASSEIFPGFLWVIPVGENLYRVGLFSNGDYKIQNKLLDSFLKDNFSNENYEIIEKYKGSIPIFDKQKKIVKNRAILIGDAASQIKPTTGGGLLIGFDSCKIASKNILAALNEDTSLLNNYSKEFNKKYSKELNYQIKVQKTLSILSNEDLNYFFDKLKINDCEKLISEHGDMDKQSILVKEFLKRGLIFKIIPSLFIKKILRIWNIKEK